MTSSVQLEIIDAGWLTTFQDLGRRASERLGVATSGAADQYSASVANILVGNDRTATLLEVMGAEFSFRVSAGTLMAVTGTPAQVSVDGYRAEQWQPVFVAGGSVVTVTVPEYGLRTYIAFNGELESPRFFGSTAPDARMGFPQRLTAGSTATLYSEYKIFVHPFGISTPFTLNVPIPDLTADVWVVDVVNGPETTAIAGIEQLMSTSTYTVGDRSDHIGLRLDGPVLHPRGLGEIVSHGVPIGAVEIPHSDELIILGRARSLTAGYPIVGVASSTSLAMLGQTRPGRRLTFRWVDRASAVDSYREKRRDLRLLERRVHALFDAVGLPSTTGTLRRSATA